MCQFKIIINEEVMFKDVVYIKVEKEKVIVKDVLGYTKEFIDYRITEVDVNNERLVLSHL